MTVRGLLGGITFCAWLCQWVRVVADCDLELAANALVASGAVWAAVMVRYRGQSLQQSIHLGTRAFAAWVVFFSWTSPFILALAPRSASLFATYVGIRCVFGGLGLALVSVGFVSGFFLHQQLRSLLLSDQELSKDALRQTSSQPRLGAFVRRPGITKGPADSLRQMKRRLAELRDIDPDFPLDENVIFAANRPAGMPPAFGSTPGAHWLRALYEQCDGLSFPDVHVGYFLKPLERVLVFDRTSEPDTIVADRRYSVLPIGSTGGGDLFVVACDVGNVLLLPPAHLHDGQYEVGQLPVKDIAPTVADFIERLLDDLIAFVDDDHQHPYMA